MRLELFRHRLLLALILAGFFVAGQARAQAPSSSVVMGPPPPGQEPMPTAEAQCGSDRRCRIERLRNLTRQRRVLRTTTNYRAWVRLQERRRQIEHNSLSRRRRPWTIAHYFGDPFVGFIAGFHPIEQIHLGVTGAFRFGTSSSSFNENEDIFTQINEALDVGMEVRWLIISEPVTPYIGAGFHVLLGGASRSVNRFSSDDFRMNDFSFEEGAMQAHYAVISAGAEVQFDFGLRIRLGAVFRPLVYVLVEQNDETFPELEQAVYDSWNLFGVEAGLGWSF